MQTKRPNWVPSDVGGWGGPGGPGSGRPTQADISPPSRQIFPPWLYPMPQGNDFFVTTIGGAKSAVLAAGIGATLRTDVFTLPGESAGVVRFVSIFVNAPTLLIDVNWILLINGSPVPGWNLTTYPRVAQNLSIDFEGVIRVPVGADISILIQNNAASGPWTVGAQFSGWYWSKRSADELYGGIY